MEDEYETIADAKKGLEEAENELNESRAKLDDLRQQLKDAEARFDNAVINHARVKELYEKASLNQPSQWNTMYQKLLQWKEEHGNCLVPNSRDANDDMKQLSKWVMNQRVFYKYFMNGDTKHIREDRVEALKKVFLLFCNLFVLKFILLLPTINLHSSTSRSGLFGMCLIIYGTRTLRIYGNIMRSTVCHKLLLPQ